jgi:hypothetical protein
MEPRTRDSRSDAGFAVTLGGEFDIGEDYSVEILAAASWVIEIEATKSEVRYAVAPTTAWAAKEALESGSHTATMRRDHPGPTFQARIFVRSGSAPKGLGDAYGVRVYMEGFRVLPYGEPGDDWLDVNRRYAVRGRSVPFRGEIESERLADVQDAEAGLVATPLRGIFGGVFLTEAGAPTLRMLVNREGFVPDEAFLDIADEVSNGLALQTRTSAALRPDRRLRVPTTPVDAADLDAPDPWLPVRGSLDIALEEIRAVSSQPDVSPEVRAQLVRAEAQLARVQDDVIDEQAMLRVLASLGTQTAAFVHEINASLGSIASLQRVVAAMLDRPPGPKELAALQRRVDVLQRTIERQSAYLVEIVSRDVRRRRSRRRYAQHFDISALLLQEAADREKIKLRNEIPPDRLVPDGLAFVLSTWTSLWAVAVEQSARHYGGGVLKLKPGSTSGLPVVRHDDINALDELDVALRNEGIDAARGLADGLILKDTLGFSPDQIRALRASALALKLRRAPRVRPSIAAGGLRTT